MARSVYCNYSNTCIICINTKFKYITINPNQAGGGAI